MFDKRITIFAGHYGSGKTNLAVNYAAALRHAFPERRIILADMDIVNPYFKSADAAEYLAAKNITLIAPQFANTNLDAPALPGELFSIFHDEESLAVIDLGGDDRGSCALGRFAELLINPAIYDMLLVVNFYRPLTRTPQNVAGIRNEIEAASGVAFTGVVNNSNIGAETTAQDVSDSMEYINRVTELCKLPLIFTSVRSDLASSFPELNTFGITVTETGGKYGIV